MSAENQFIPAAQLKKNYVVVGNSFSVYTPPTSAWPYVMSQQDRYLQSTVINNATAGKTLASSITDFNTEVGPYAPATTGLPLVVFLPSAAAVDIIGGSTAAAAYALVTTYVGLVHGIGGKIVVGDIPKGTSYAGGVETVRLAFNALVAAGAANGDFDHYWPASVAFNSTTAAYMAGDGQHFTVLGMQIMALMADAAVNDQFRQSVLGDLPATTALTNGWTILADDFSTLLWTLTNAGTLTIAGSFGVGGVTPRAAIDSGAGVFTGGTFASSQRCSLNLSCINAAGGVADITFPGGTSGGVQTIRWSQATFVGTNDIIEQGVGSGTNYFVVEGANVAGLALSTSSAVPIIFRPNRTTTVQMHSSGGLSVGAANVATDPGSGAIVATKYFCGTCTWTVSAATPEGAVTAPVGSIHSRTNGGAGTSFYVKESGAGNTGWVGK